MLEFLLRVGRETWSILEEASAFFLVGFLLAGVLGVVVPSGIIARRVGAGRVTSVLWATIVGAPLPLCSCGVLPAALALRRQGATNGATVAFLVATPETGLDSLAVSYSLTDPLLTVSRLVAGVIAAITSGIAVNLLGTQRPKHVSLAIPVAGDSVVASGDQACCPHDASAMRRNSHFCTHPGALGACDAPPAPSGGEVPQPWGWNSMRGVASRVWRYAFRDLLDETSHWLVLGIALSGFVAGAVPDWLLDRYLGNGITSMLAMVLIGVPIYTCASSSTPVAAALVLKGLSPGAALVFLLTGPATNLGSLVVLWRFLGPRVVAVYVSITIGIALLAGSAVNWMYQARNLDPRTTFGTGAEFLPQSLKIICALLFLLLLLTSLLRSAVPPEWTWLNQRLSELVGRPLSAADFRAIALAAMATLYLGSGFFEIQPGDTGILFRFGRPVAGDVLPGLHYRLPWPVESDQVINRDFVRRILFGVARTSARGTESQAAPRQDLMFGTPTPVKSGGLVFRKEAASDDSFFLTGDGNLIDLRFTVHYRVKDARAFAFSTRDPEALIRSTALSVLRAAVATSGIDAVYTTEHGELDARISQTIQQELDRFRSGLQVLSVHFLYVHPPDEVHDAFRDVASAQEDKLRTINRAKTFAIEEVNESKGEAAAMIEQALGFKEDRIRRAQGDAEAFTRQMESYRQAPELARFRLRLEAAEEVLPGTQKIITPGSQAVKDLDMWLPHAFKRAGEAK